MFEDIQVVLDKMTPLEQQELLTLMELYKKQQDVQNAGSDFMSFVKFIWPEFIMGRHHKIMAKKFQEIANGTLKRLIINIAPRHTKSMFGSYLLPAWFMGLCPDRKIIQASHTADLALKFGRDVRNLVGSEKFSEVFPDVSLQADSKAAGKWSTNRGGSYYAVGVGGAVAGYGGDLVIIDDPHSEQDGKSLNPESFDATYDWYMTGPRQRLQPGGAILIIMCMTGDTDVLLADGTTSKLKYLQVGDSVATYEDGKITTSRVNNWKSNGVDTVYTVQTQSGIIFKANERHPFLVDFEGKRQWIRLRNLKVGMQLVTTKAAQDRRDHKRSQRSVRPVSQLQATIKNILTPHTALLDIMGNGRENLVSSVGTHQFTAVDCAFSVTESSTHHQSKLQSRIEQGESSTDTESPLSNMTSWLRSAATDVIYAANRLLRRILAPTGAESSVLTTAMKLERSEGCCATTATSQLDTEKPLKFSVLPLDIYSVFTDPIVDISYSGEEEVFDVEINRTENFIANGVVSHNTRWSKRDLTGKLLDYAARNPDSDQWEVIEFPAIMPSGQPLWPEYWPLDQLLQTKATIHPRFWAAQYQQEPTSAESAIIKREWWKIWEDEEPPKVEYVIQSWDTAFTKGERNDFNACTTWGVFYIEDNAKTGKMQPNVILLDSFKEKMEFPELKEVAFKHYKEQNPDTLIVEAKASGLPLIQELRQTGIPVQEFSPSKGNDKIARMNSIADLFSAGVIWCPDTNWARELMEEAADFPNGDHDDLCDSMSQALIRYRQGGFIRLPTDDWQEPKPRRQGKGYY